MDIHNANANDYLEDEVIEITLKDLENFRKDCADVILKSKHAQKLSNNPEFIKVIMEDYFTREPERLGSLLASGKLTPAGFDGAVSDLKSIGHLREYLSDQVQRGVIAEQTLAETEEAYNAHQESLIKE